MAFCNKSGSFTLQLKMPKCCSSPQALALSVALPISSHGLLKRRVFKGWDLRKLIFIASSRTGTFKWKWYLFCCRAGRRRGTQWPSVPSGRPWLRYQHCFSTTSTNTKTEMTFSFPSQAPRKGLRDPQRNHTGRLLLEGNPGNGHQRTPGGVGGGGHHTHSHTLTHSLYPTFPFNCFTSLPLYLYYFLIKQCAKLINGETELTLTFDS